MASRGIPRTTLIYRMRKLGIPADKFSRLRPKRSRVLLAVSREHGANNGDLQTIESAPVFSEAVA